MGRARQRTQRQEQSPQNVTEEIAVILLSGAAIEAMASKITPLLLSVLPPALLRLPDLAGDVVEEAARLIAADADTLQIGENLGARGAGVSGIIRAAKLDNVLYRALYGMAAARRIGASVLDSAGGNADADTGGDLQLLREAATRERSYFEAHRDVSKRRVSAAKTVQGLVELHGPLLSWNWGETRKPREPRPTHLAADGANWRPLNGAPLSTGSLPGVEKNCSCAAGPPKRGARILR